jgi:site-specific DNA recombinase
MNQFFGYIRVSTAKQGEHGVSLQEQRDAIARYAQRFGLTIVAWFEERQTAAKGGRPVFTQMLARLRRGDVDGVVMHKIDRSARNLKDWADLGELIDHGITVHFVNESLDLHTRGGRLSADIQAVVAADYIRNLREEARKGFYGRLKQGFYPLPAPLGYLDRGKARVKEPDPARAPLVRRAFELYATGRYNLFTLNAELHRLGLRNRRGGQVTRTGLSTLLNNPFYIGLIQLRRTGETFQGAHPALVSKALFDRVRAVLIGRTNQRVQSHDFLFRRLLSCAGCGHALTGEVQKGHTYYRCHSPTCTATCIREEAIDDEVHRTLRPLELSPEEITYAEKKLAQLSTQATDDSQNRRQALTLNLRALEDRLNRLTDAYVDRLIDKPLFESRKPALLLERKELDDSLAQIDQDQTEGPRRLGDFFELVKSASLQYEMGLPAEKRDLLNQMTSNRTVTAKNVAITLKIPFQEIADRYKNANSAPYRDVVRTWDRLLERLLEWAKLSLQTPEWHPDRLNRGKIAKKAYHAYGTVAHVRRYVHRGRAASQGESGVARSQWSDPQLVAPDRSPPG